MELLELTDTIDISTCEFSSSKFLNSQLGLQVYASCAFKKLIKFPEIIPAANHLVDVHVLSNLPNPIRDLSIRNAVGKEGFFSVDSLFGTFYALSAQRMSRDPGELFEKSSRDIVMFVQLTEQKAITVKIGWLPTNPTVSFVAFDVSEKEFFTWPGNSFVLAYRGKE